MDMAAVVPLARIAVAYYALESWPSIEGMFALFVEFVLEFEALLVGFRGANGFDDSGDPVVHVPLAEFTGGHRTVTGVVVREAAVPPDAGVDIVRQVYAFLVCAGFAGGAIEVDEVGTRNHGVGGFVFPGVVIDAV